MRRKGDVRLHMGGKKCDRGTLFAVDCLSNDDLHVFSGFFLLLFVRHDYPGQKDEQSTTVNADTVCHSI
jgi:hypothetical protein